MTDNDQIANRFQVSQLSAGPDNPPTWAIAVFAHNEAKYIRQALEGIAAASGGRDIAIYVLANGCTDATVAEVRASASSVSNLWLVEIQIGDKANAWNLFIHDIFPASRSASFETYFFMDGDVRLAPNTLALLASALDSFPGSEAAGGMPATGRDRDAWRQRMVANGMLAGNCYALTGGFVQQLRAREIRMPVGLIGEDFFVSWLVANDLWRNESIDSNQPRCVFHGQAEFSFRSLSPWRPADYRTYLHRKWRYMLRGLQHQMLILLLMEQGLEAMPADVKELYRTAPLPSRLHRAEPDRLLRLIAVQWIRTFRDRAGNG